MRHAWVPYVVVTLVAAGAGLAIAGLPGGAPEAGLASLDAPSAPDPVVTTTPGSTTTPATTSTAVPETTAPETTAPETTAPETTTTATTSTSTTTSTTTTTTLPLVDRADLVVVAVNGANAVGIAGRTATELNDLGYERTRTTDGTIIAAETVVYHLPELRAEGARLAEDLGIPDAELRPIVEENPFRTLDGDQLAVYIGVDRA